MICFINKHVIGFCFTCKKWCTVFRCHICIIVFSYCYISCNQNKCIRIITKAWFNAFCFKFNRIVLVVFTFCCLTVYNISFFVANLDSSLLESFSKFVIFCVSILYNAYKILWKFKSCFFWFFNDEKHCCFIFFKFTNKLICCFKSGFSKSICMLKSIAISL